MGLFDFFKKSNEKNTSKEKDSHIKVSSTDKGSQGDHFGGMIGFELLHSEGGAKLVYQFIEYADKQDPSLQKGAMNLRDAVLNEVNETSSKLRVRAIHTGENIPSAFPYLKTTCRIPFKTREVIEWSHIDNVEAEIYGEGRDTFALGFFATDYAVNKEIYKTQEDLEVHVSAIVLAMEEEDLSKDSNSEGLKFAKDFASYMPNNNLPGISYYDFMGKIIDLEEMIVIPDPEVRGYMMRIKLINHENPDFFTIDMFVNKNNTTISEMKKGMSVSGTIWMQGELSS
ncbi:MAG: hypothetical protein JXR05_07895 [Flavobacteriaceae bacterium]